MTMQEREEIFAKECLDSKDFQKLYGVSYGKACEMIRHIKLRLTIGLKRELRLDMKGKIHKQDYYDWRDGVKGDAV